MAGSPPLENSSLFDAAESSRSPLPRSPQPAPHDWEMLSMSTMSASTLGLPSQKPHESETLADVLHKDDGVTVKAGYDAPISDGSSPHLRASTSGPEAYTKDSEKDKDLDDTQPVVEFVHDDVVAAEENPEGSVSSGRDEDIPVIALKKKTIKVSWWKRQVVIWPPQPHKYGAMFSIALVAAAVGVAVIGCRWHRERILNQQLRLELSSKEEKLNDMVYQVSRMKEAMTGRRRVGVTRSSFF